MEVDKENDLTVSTISLKERLALKKVQHSAAELETWSVRLKQEEAEAATLPDQQKHEHLCKVYGQATKELHDARGPECTRIWMRYALLQECALPPLPAGHAESPRAAAPPHS